MTVEDLETLFDYSYWANAGLRDALSRMTIETRVREFVATLQDRDLDRVVEFALGGGARQSMALGQLLHHAAVHGVHHRGQVALLLRTLGYVPGNFDILLYYARGRPPAWSHEHAPAQAPCAVDAAVDSTQAP